MSSSNKTSPLKKSVKPNDDKLEKAKINDDVGVKEQEDEDHSMLSDPEDYLEENESLDTNLTNVDKKIWLVKLPRYLAERWSNIDQMKGDRIGTVKIRQGKPNNTGERKLEVKLVLDSKHKYDDIPSEYDISMLNTQVRNSYVFSEENLSKFKQEFTEMVDMPEQPELQPIDKKNAQTKPYKYYKVQKNKDGPEGQGAKKYIPFVKTIPKKTSIVGKVCHDCQIIPSKHDKQYMSVLLRRQGMQAAKPRPKVTLLEEIPGVVQSNAGPSIKGNNTSVFLKSHNNKNRNIEGRAIRMPKKDLLDLLFRLFDEYEYWSMKGLKERTRQPESYLKESLDSIANLIKKGPYTSKYNLKPEYRKLREAERAARLGFDNEDNENNENDNMNEDENDFDDDMENVI